MPNDTPYLFIRDSYTNNDFDYNDTYWVEMVDLTAAEDHDTWRLAVEGA